MGLDADLTAYYDAEARGGYRNGHGDHRVGLRRRFAELLAAEGRRRLVDVGAGPGLDTEPWQADEFAVVGVDLAPANVDVMAQRGLLGTVGSLYDLPFRTGGFEALWTMSTFVHVPRDRIDEALAELLRVVRPGAPLGIGTWGGLDFEGVVEFGELRPYRFFALSTHETWRSQLARYGDVELFDTHGPFGNHDWEYQFAVLRASR